MTTDSDTADGCATSGSIPLVDVAPLFGTEPAAWRIPDRALAAAARDIGFVCIRGLPGGAAPGRGVRGDYFDDSFRRGLSTLRLIRYPPRDDAELAGVRDPAVWVDDQGLRRYLVGASHTDSGFITLLAQDGVPGLQARLRTGQWVDVPPLEGTLVVNFGQVLEQWSAGRIRATEHRVLGSGRERFSIPFFHEARADATITPLPVDRPDLFAPFEYGDFLWKRMTSFVEFRGMERERRQRGPGA